jgi:glycosyltransferase involved in cell wall biosynthesis
MKAAFVVYAPFPRYSGGKETWLYQMVSTLGEWGHESLILAYASNRQKVFDLDGLKHVRLKVLPSIRYFDWLFRAVNKALFNIPFMIDALLYIMFTTYALARHAGDCDFIVAMNPIIESFPVMLYRRLGGHFKHVTIVHGYVVEELSFLWPWLRCPLYWAERATLSEADIIIANGEDTRKYLNQIGFSQVVAVSVGIDVERFIQTDVDPVLEDVIRQTGYPRNKIVLSVATLRRIKGIHYLIESVPEVKHLYGKNFRVVFVGKGRQTEYINMAKKLGVLDQVYFAGEQSNVPAFLSLADVVCCLSDGGGRSLSTLEAMAAGKAIVAWDTPVYTQMLTDGVSAVLVPHGDTQQLANAVVELLRDPVESQRLGKQAFAAAQPYDRRAFVRELLELMGE